MKRIWQFVNVNIIAVTLGGILSTLVVGTGIWQALTGAPVTLLRSVPVNVRWAVGGGAVVAVLAVAVAVIARGRSNRTYERSDPVIAVARRPIFGWREFFIDYAGMSWVLVVPRPPSWEPKGPLGFNAGDAKVDGPPRCPKCRTGLEERRTVFGRYRVKCVGCGFEGRQRDSFAVLAPRAERVGQRRLEEAAERQRQLPD